MLSNMFSCGVSFVFIYSVLGLHSALAIESAIECNTETVEETCSPGYNCIGGTCVIPCDYTSCGTNAVCEVKNRKSTCHCEDGFVSDAAGTACSKVDCSKNDDCPDNKACDNAHCVDPCSSSVCGTNTDCNVKNHTAACTCKPNHIGNPFNGCTPAECSVSSDCPAARSCVDSHCEDPCSRDGVCGANSDCIVKEHSPSCTCREGHVGDPYRGCSPVECLKNENCPDNTACDNTHCVDPCSSTVCGTNADCNVKNHTAACSCKTNYTGDPFTGCTPGASNKSTASGISTSPLPGECPSDYFYTLVIVQIALIVVIATFYFYNKKSSILPLDLPLMTSEETVTQLTT